MSKPREIKYKYIYIDYPDGRKKTMALSTFTGKVVRGVATCAPEDFYDKEYGEKLAAARCNLKVAEKRAKRADGKLYYSAYALSKANEVYKKNKFYSLDASVRLDAAREELKTLTK